MELKVTEEIIDAAMIAFAEGHTCNRAGIESCLERAFKALADRPLNMLTVDEYKEIRNSITSEHSWWIDFGRAIEAAVHKKQSEPDEVPFDYEKWRDGGWQAIEHHPDHTVTVSQICFGLTYTMRRAT